jgi:hypothetical protein
MYNSSLVELFIQRMYMYNSNGHVKNEIYKYLNDGKLSIICYHRVFADYAFLVRAWTI